MFLLFYVSVDPVGWSAFLLQQWRHDTAPNAAKTLKKERRVWNLGTSQAHNLSAQLVCPGMGGVEDLAA